MYSLGHMNVISTFYGIIFLQLVCTFESSDLMVALNGNVEIPISLQITLWGLTNLKAIWPVDKDILEIGHLKEPLLQVTNKTKYYLHKLPKAGSTSVGLLVISVYKIVHLECGNKDQFEKGAEDNTSSELHPFPSY